MVGAAALTNPANPPDKFLKADFTMEEPLVLQLGGANVLAMKSAASIAAEYGYKSININAGCPSQNVAEAGCFGAALMQKPRLVADMAHAMSSVTNVPTTVKCRLGINNEESYESLANFINIVYQHGGVNHFIVHARNAILDKKFSPDQNRCIPPLKYDYVYRLCRDFPHVNFTLNGGVKTYDEIKIHLKEGVSGVMVGRAVIQDPYYWAGIDSQIYGCTSGNNCAMSLQFIC